MQYKLLVSDFDNTLVPFGEPKPRPAVVKAVKKLQAAGGKFVLSTGRSYPGIRDKNQLGGIRYDYAITCNGACVVDRQGNVIAEHPLTSEEMYVLVDFCEDYNYPLQFNFRDAFYAYCRRQTEAHCARAERTDKLARLGEYEVLWGPHLMLAYAGGDNYVAF